MQIQIEDGYIVGFAKIGGFEGGIEVSEKFIDSLDTSKIGFYKYVDGQAVLDEEKYNNQSVISFSYIPSKISSLENMCKILLKTYDIPKDNILEISGLYDDWAPGDFKIGDIRNSGDQTWECYQNHNTDVYPDIIPDNPTWFTFWRPLHGKTIDTARPFTKTKYSGSHDTYKPGEYMVYTDNYIYECVIETIYSPDEYAYAWKKTSYKKEY